MKLGCFIHLLPDEKAAIGALVQQTNAIPAEQSLIEDGEVQSHTSLLLQGFAYRYKLLSNGRRQILGYLIPGDFCEAELRNGGRSDHCVAALNNAVVAPISIQSFTNLRGQYPNIHRACMLASLSERSILREWIVNVGQKTALQRISHFFCEIVLRLEAIGRLQTDGSIDFPLNQVALADTAGLTTVHVNRSLKRLRDDGLIAFSRQRLKILDRERLIHVAGFDEEYLRLKRYSD
jgi:CRP-like cAMP-binding protein